MSGASPQAYSWNKLPRDVPPGALQSILSYFGIYDRVKDDGVRSWTIDLQRDNSVSPRQQVWFDDSTQSWKLSLVAQMADEPAAVSTKTVPGKEQDLANNAPQPEKLDNQPRAVVQWIDRLPKTSHVNHFRNANWQRTALGPLETWPSSLRLYTHMVHCQQAPAAVHWGEDLITIYNEGVIPLIGQKHPSFMASPFFGAWPELESSFSTVFGQIIGTGIGIELSDYNIFLERHGYTEESWWRGNLFPLAREDGLIGGCCSIWNEVTRQVLSDRRTQLLNELGNFDVNLQVDIWDHILQAMTRDPRDIAMAILYSVDDNASSKNRILRREGVIGTKTDHLAAPVSLNLDTSTSGFAPWMRDALKSESGWIAVNKSTGLPLEMLNGIDWQGYGEQSNDVVVMPITVVGNDVRGFAILGMNPRRTFDADHQQFVINMQRQLTTTMSAVTSKIDAQRREAKLMAHLADSEKRIRQLAELAPMGLFDLSTDGLMRWANNHYFRIMGIPRPSNIADTPWIDPVDPEDLARVKEIFQACIESGNQFSGTVKLSRKWEPPQPMSQDVKQSNVHILFEAFSFKEEGVSTSIMGSITDVSSFVWAESVQANAADNAKLERARQEEFVDIISHELRNPLSAIMQSAEGILQSLKELDSLKIGREPHAISESCREAADTIILCASHQKRIVDDVLTLSKLDSNLITLNPVAFHPSSIQNEVVQMFQYDFALNNISMVANYNEENVASTSSVFGDASRISQILVNLVSNAIKYHKDSGEHKIIITAGLSRQPPTSSTFGPHFSWSESGKTYDDATLQPEYGTDEIVYLYFSVEDTGLGLPREKAVQIFDKFVQANRRSHSKYGGSGLGLYISRQLTEMQGGLIGVGSEAGVGSTFAFYSKLRLAPAQDTIANDPKPEIVSLDSVNTLSLLLVEDNLINQKVLAKQLRKVGYTVYVANHGGEAVDFLLKANDQSLEFGTANIAEAKRVDCVLMDWEMPVLDGLATTQRIRELEQAKSIKDRQVIIGITANARKEQIDCAMEAGMNTVVTKPFHISELVAQIQKFGVS